MSAAAAQLRARNIVIENTSATSILCRVSYQKSAISQQNLRGFSKLITENKQSHGKGAKFNIGIPQFVEFGVGFNVEHAQEQQQDETQFNQADVELMVSQFNEDGWIPIQSQKQRRFAIQGQIAHISALSADGKVILHNWNTMGSQYLYDGTDFEEQHEVQVTQVSPTSSNAGDATTAAAPAEFQVVIVNPKKLNESAERKTKKNKKEAGGELTEHTTSQETKPLKQDSENAESATSKDQTAHMTADDDDESFAKIASLLYPCCCGDATMNNSFYAFFGVGICFCLLGFFSVIWNAISLWLFIPCHYTAVMKRSWLLLKCEAMPFSFKYRKMRLQLASDDAEDESEFKRCNNPCGICWTSFIW
eukprot:CAMPEP_0202696924 /NCGR_PEP_ID=MMETSP1385-20130828/10247_1 /ASSEMBLY_ACC=CAM_ASM_000861 /TAXON_ID=933848 /ORGANISM="Elphidium margaritaceum" /LENGTH=362 /DNA_ID=CAMNT_0049353237 /DNA_START=6 /DNA_END=1091 /DNA_ORIENTATION=-